MSDPFPKRVEIAFRRGLLRFIAPLVRRSNPFSGGVDFNHCKFLFVRQDMVGDVLVSTPLFTALKQRYPGATIDVLLSFKNHFVLANNPYVRKRWVYQKTAASAIDILRSIRQERYDFVVDLMDNPSATSSILCVCSGARWTVGIEKSNSFAYDITVPMLSREQTHISERIVQLLRPFEIKPESVSLTPYYRPAPEARTFAQKTVRDLGMDGKPIVGINISAGTDVRFWGVENFRTLLKSLSQSDPDLKCLVLYKPADASRARSIAAGLANVVCSPVTQQFDMFAALLERVSLLVTPDTSAVHLAAAFHIPSVVMYVQSDKRLNIWKPYGIDAECLVTDVDDLSTIAVDDVTAALQRLRSRNGLNTRVLAP